MKHLKLPVGSWVSFAALTCVLQSQVVRASESIIFEEVDIAPLVEYYGKQVLTLNKPVLVYNWSPKAAKGDGPELTPLFKKSAESFWKNYGTDPGQNAHGLGLYVAADPAISAEYGGTESGKALKESALLTQIQLPKGFRFIDLQRQDKPKSDELPKNIGILLSHFKCIDVPNSWAPSQMQIFFSNANSGGSGQPASCQQLGRKIFKDILKIDGFSYDYGSYHINGCDDESPLKGRAFVITRAEWMNTSSFKFYTQYSRNDYENRRLIQTLFLKSFEHSEAEEMEFWDGLEFVNFSRFVDRTELTEFLKNHPDSNFKSSTKICDHGICSATGRFCDANEICSDVVFAPKIRPGGELLSKDDASYTNFKDFFWDDLEGKPKTLNTEEWAKENLFGCSGEQPYEESL